MRPGERAQWAVLGCVTLAMLGTGFGWHHYVVAACWAGASLAQVVNLKQTWRL